MPSASLINHWLRNFEETENTMPHKSTGRIKTSRTKINVDCVRRSILGDPRHPTIAGRFSKFTLFAIFTFSSLQIVDVQEMKPDDPTKIVQFFRIMRNHFRSFKNIWLSDEYNFYINVRINKQICRYLTSDNPLQLHQNSIVLRNYQPKLYRDYRARAKTVIQNDIAIWFGLFWLQKCKTRLATTTIHFSRKIGQHSTSQMTR